MGLPPVIRLYKAAGGRASVSMLPDDVLRSGHAGVNPGKMWRLAATRVYRNIDLPVIATREALQNSRDAIDGAAGLLGARKTPPGGPWIGKDEGRFAVTIDPDNYSIQWEDNGSGMDPDTVFSVFLTLADSDKVGGEGEAGGFGIAKAVILGGSRSFKWEMHSRDHVYIADGFSEPVRAYKAPFYLKGTRLKVFDMAPHWFGNRDKDGYSQQPLESRIRYSLSMNNLNPKPRHAGVRLFTNTVPNEPQEVTPRFRGRPQIILKGAPAGENTHLTVRAYKTASDNEVGVVRLDGLYQYDSSRYGTGVDLVFDVFTKQVPSDEGYYPLVWSRDSLAEPALSLYYDVTRQVKQNAASATVEAETTRTLGFNQADEERVEAGLKANIAAYEKLLSDRAFTGRMERMQGSGEVFRAMQRSLNDDRKRWAEIQEVRRARERDSERERLRREEEGDDFWDRRSSEPAPAPPTPPPSQPVGSRRVKREKLPPKPKVNPLAGIVSLQITKEQFPYKRLRRFYSNPQRWIGYAIVWRLACRMILDELGESWQSFTPGFIFDDKALAAYSYDGDTGEQTLLVNPLWLESVIKAYKNKPLAVAAVLHSKACHEVTHLLEGDRTDSGHGEYFSRRRESVADETVAVIYPLAAASKALLKLRGTVGGGRGNRGGFALPPSLTGPAPWCGSCRGRGAKKGFDGFPINQAGQHDHNHVWWKANPSKAKVRDLFATLFEDVFPTNPYPSTAKRNAAADKAWAAHQAALGGKKPSKPQRPRPPTGPASAVGSGSEIGVIKGGSSGGSSKGSKGSKGLKGSKGARLIPAHELPAHMQPPRPGESYAQKLERDMREFDRKLR
jgi:hypothetical protein